MVKAIQVSVGTTSSKVLVYIVYNVMFWDVHHLVDRRVSSLGSAPAWRIRGQSGKAHSLGARTVDARQPCHRRRISVPTDRFRVIQ